jgi:hypothetical protein
MFLLYLSKFYAWSNASVTPYAVGHSAKTFLEFLLEKRAFYPKNVLVLCGGIRGV